MRALLEAKGLTVRFGGLIAMNEVDLAVAEGAIHGIIGPNGAGKTTFFNAITGLVQTSAGRIVFDGTDITPEPPFRRARRGMRRTFQSVQIIPQLTVLENVLIGLSDQGGGSTFRSLFGLSGRDPAEEAAQARVVEVLDFLGIGHTLFKRPPELSFAEQRYVEIARALASRPKLLMFDEPAAGLSPGEVQALNGLLRRVRAESKVTMILVEHVLSLVFDVSDRITVFEHGRVIAEGAPKEIEADPRVKAAYLETSMLEIRGVEAGYGALRVLRGIDLSIPQGKVVALLGGNGAGKTTTMKTIIGVIRASAGEITLAGERIDRLSSHAIFARGLALVPQGRELFPDMSVYENLELGALSRGVKGAAVKTLVDEVYDYFPRLRERAEQRAGSLSGGEQQMLSTGRALMSRPSVLLLDEPTSGLAPLIVAELARTLKRLNAKGQTILLVEQNVRMALSIADYVYVIRTGEIVHGSSAAEIDGSDAVFSAYMG